LIVSGCGGGSGSSGSHGSSKDCGETQAVPPGDLGGSAGGTAYKDVEGLPVVSNAGGGVTCEKLRALADAYAKLQGVKLISWLDQHKWTWMNYDKEAMNYSTFDLDKNNVFIGFRPGQRSQVAFGSP
jgi:hypothetical protein